VKHRRPLDLYHCALEVRVPEGRFVIENAWPIPDAGGDPAPACSAPELLQDGSGVAVGLDVVPGPLDPALLVEQEGRAQDADRGAAVAGLLPPGAQDSMTAWSASVRRGNPQPVLVAEALVAGAVVGETPITGTPAAWKPARLSLNWQASLVHTVSSSSLTAWPPGALGALPAMALQWAAGRP